MPSFSGWALLVTAVIELVVVSWCALWPLRWELGLLTRAWGWWRLDSFSLGNLDVLILAVLKDAAVGGLVLSAPGSRGHGGGAPVASNHDGVRQTVTGLCLTHAVLLLVKAAAVAVTAPPDLWPPPPGSAPPTGPVVVGLVFMYTSLVVSILASLIGQAFARLVVSEREDAWEDDLPPPPADPLRLPLLQPGAAEAEAAAAEAGAGAGGGKGAGGGAEAAGAAGIKAGAGEGQTRSEKRRAAAKAKQRTIVELLRLSSVDSPLLLVAFSAGIVAALGSALIPHFTGQIIDFALRADRRKFTRTTLQLLGVAALTGVFAGTRGGLFTVAITRLNVRLRKQLFHALLQFEIGYFDTTKTGEITSRLAADTSTVADQVGLNLNVLLRSATQAVMVLVFMFASSWRLTVVTFILVPVVLTISKVYGKYYSRLAKKVQAELAAANGVAEEVLSTMTTVKAHAAQDSAEASYASKLGDFYRLQVAEAWLYTLYAAINTFLPNSVTAVVLFYGGTLVLKGEMSSASLFSFMLFQQSLSSAFQSMGDVFSSLTAAVGAADKVIELMRRQPAIPPSGSLALPRLEGRVELRDVGFAYPARPHARVLDGLSLTAQPGEVVALVGSSGGGKSSIVKLLERFYLPMSGSVLLDGHDLGLLDAKWLRRQVALVSQEPILYARSIRRNIVFGMEAEDGCAHPPTEEEVIEAAKQANAHDFISAFPEGYDTSCGEKGVALSGGQKQRIAIARALVRRPRVLLLDEATSALDADSEAVVQEALDRVMAGRTVIVIAHRLSTIQNADRIYVIGKGRVQEVGTHMELLAAGGVYAQLVRRQLTRPISQASLAGSLWGAPGDGEATPSSTSGQPSAGPPGPSQAPVYSRAYSAPGWPTAGDQPGPNPGPGACSLSPAPSDPTPSVRPGSTSGTPSGTTAEGNPSASGPSPGPGARPSPGPSPSKAALLAAARRQLANILASSSDLRPSASSASLGSGAGEAYGEIPGGALQGQQGQGPAPGQGQGQG
ncbi:hypothetical protein HYH03_007724 [Edaphochlamys debaryana]|uniref:Uncharacterized protein n=1 Tax=Edaphochlamys debaryana TaxID=47281 RepID=A0A836BZL6_9CHLO|nr:hypothetical protein HYH03_007724 [Edaphochlamys debaryana]|eukprot:KAG2494082.1 hypothetical protein HYH03_007724 [Edaphochlamys debaryana]